MPCRTSGHDSIPEEDFAQNEMDLGELGGDELNVQQDEEDGDDDGAFDKQPKNSSIVRLKGTLCCKPLWVAVESLMPPIH